MSNLCNDASMAMTDADARVQGVGAQAISGWTGIYAGLQVEMRVISETLWMFCRLV